MKHARLLITLFILFLVFIVPIYSHAIDMYLQPSDLETSSDEVAYSTTEEEVNNLEEVSQVVSESPNTKTGTNQIVTSRNVSTKNELTSSDIINIILIAVSVVIIMLGVAILIRCK